MDTPECNCSVLRVGNKKPDPKGHRAIRDSCPFHGIGTQFYLDAIAKAKKALDAMRAKGAKI